MSVGGGVGAGVGDGLRLAGVFRLGICLDVPSLFSEKA